MEVLKLALTAYLNIVSISNIVSPINNHWLIAFSIELAVYFITKAEPVNQIGCDQRAL